MANKKIELGVDTKKVKVQFNTSTPAFREVMGNYWVAVVELADMTKVYANNVRILSESVASLTEKSEKQELTAIEKQRLELDQTQLEEYSAKYATFKAETDARFNKCYELITAELYPAYNAYARTQELDGFAKALTNFFVSHNIESTDSLAKFMLSVVGMRKAPANTKVKTKGATLLIAQTPKCFNELFMHALAQLMVDKNCIKTDRYTFTYEKATSAHLQSKLDDVKVPEEEKTEEVTVPQEEETVEYGTKTLKELKALAQERGIKGYSKMKKEELVTILALA